MGASRKRSQWQARVPPGVPLRGHAAHAVAAGLGAPRVPGSGARPHGGRGTGGGGGGQGLEGVSARGRERAACCLAYAHLLNLGRDHTDLSASDHRFGCDGNQLQRPHIHSPEM